MYMLTEEQIEYAFERVMDLLDKKFLNNTITQKMYETNVQLLNKWAEQKTPKLHDLNINFFSK
jgi:hypothetical protein